MSFIKTKLKQIDTSSDFLRMRETHTSAKKRECKTCEIQMKLLLDPWFLRGHLPPLKGITLDIRVRQPHAYLHA